MTSKKFTYKFTIEPETGHSLDFDKKMLTQIVSRYQHRQMRDDCTDEGIVGHKSLRDVEHILQTFSNPTREKYIEVELIKGLLVGGISGEHQTELPPLLPIDIDIKPEKDGKEAQNPAYLDPAMNEALFEEIEKVAVIAFRSNSGTGIAAFLHVEGLQDIEDTHEHIEAARQVTHLLNKYLKDRWRGFVPIEFDDAQNKRRQVRFLADQKGQKRELNPNHLTFHIKERTKEENFHEEGVPVYYSRNTAQQGSIEYKFNDANPIEQTLVKCGFKSVGRDRYLHPITTGGDSTGVLYPDGFKVFCTDYDPNTPTLDSFGLVAKSKNMSRYQFRKALLREGWKDDPQDLQQIQAAVDKAEGTQDLYEIAQRLKHLSPEKREWFFHNLKLKEEQRRAFEVYLGFSKYDIAYDKEVTLDPKGYVSDQIEDIIETSKQHKRMVICADTGVGKTKALLDWFTMKEVGSRVLFIAPLTVIVRQQGKEYEAHPDVVWITADTEQGRTLARHKRIVITTPQQAAKILDLNRKFDVIIKDEIHSDITTQDYRRTAYADLNERIQLEEESHPSLRVIGLTGTPIRELKNLGYYLYRVGRNTPPNKVIMRTCNKDPLQILIKHQRDVRGKALYRLNEKSTQESFKKYLLDTGMKDEEVLILRSEMKQSDAYRTLVETGKFPPEVKVVITTSLIDEGLSIYDTGFTDVVYMDNRLTYRPRPEALKQFLNRIRVQPENMQMYYYARMKNDQSPSEYVNNYEANLKYLQERDQSMVPPKFLNSLSLDKFYFNSGGEPVVNEYYLSYVESGEFFDSLNLEELRLYTERNFNIIFDYDEDYDIEEGEKANIAYYKEVNRKNKEVLTKFLQTFINSDMIESALIELSPSPTQRRELERDFPKGYATNEVMEVVRENKKTFSKIIEAKHKMIELGFDPDIHLYTRKGIIDSGRSHSAKLRLMNDLHTMLQPDETLTERERNEKENLNSFVEDVKGWDGEGLDRFDVFRLWRQYVPLKTNSKSATHNVINIVEHFTDWRYNQPKARFDRNPDKPSLLEEAKGRQIVPAEQLSLREDFDKQGVTDTEDFKNLQTTIEWL